MMTKEMVMALLATAGEDIEVGDWDDEISADVNNFEGFDEDWSEVMRELDNPDLVDSIKATLSAECISEGGDFYYYYYFEDFKVCWGYTSFNI